MNRHLKQWIIIGASCWLLAGCCTPNHATRWEYKVVLAAAVAPGGPAEWVKNQEALLNDLGKEGWIFVSQSDRVLYFKRPVK
jgi:hypothetical protein